MEDLRRPRKMEIQTRSPDVLQEIDQGLKVGGTIMAKRAAAMAARNKRVSRFEKLSDEEIAKRWREAIPRYLRWITLFGITSVGLFVFNHFAPQGQTVTNIINVAFQISTIFVVCFVMMLMMGLKYRNADKKR
jgi:hypothetical protein